MFKIEQKGNTMLETLAAISIVSILGISAIGLIGKMFDMFKQNIIEDEIKEVHKLITQRYRLEAVYSELDDLTVEDFAKQKLVPSQMIAGDKLIHKLNDEVKIKSSELGDKFFDVTFEGLPNRTCVNLALINWNANQTSDLYQIQIKGKETDKIFKLPIPDNNVSLGDDDALPMNTTKATSACDGNDNTIIWTFQ